MKISKRVKEYDFVSLRGDKFIKSSNRRKIVGVYIDEINIDAITLDGKRQSYYIPPCVVYRGIIKII